MKRIIGIACSGFLFCGCTLIGYMVGERIDKSLTDKVIVPGWRIDALSYGDSLEVIAANGELIPAIFDGLAELDFSTYEAHYAARLGLNPIERTPNPGDSLLLINQSSQESRGLFHGWGYWPQPYLLLATDSSDSGEKIRMDQISMMSALDGSVYDVKHIEQLIRQKQIASVTAIGLRTPEGTRRFPLDSVLQIQVPYHKVGTVLGVLLGMAVDGAMIYAITAYNSAYDEGYDEGYKAGYSPPPPTGSCPHVYSHNGQDYIIDSEPYAGALAEAIQRTDIDILDHLCEQQNRCRLLIANGLSETEHIDAVSLMIVDHPAEISVVPSYDGSLHSIHEPLPPVAAHDDNGADVLSLVRTKDERIWTSNPFLRDPMQISQVRDGIEICFPHPSGADNAKLLVNVQNTVWSGLMLKEMLELHGRNLDNFYEQLDSSALMRDLFSNAMIRDGALQILIWTGDSWTPAGYVYDVGSRVAKDQVVVLDVGSIAADTLLLRLESTAGFWSINSCVIDYSADVPISIHDVLPEQAVTETGQDVLALLTAIDHRHYEMPNQENSAEVTFRVFPRTMPMARTYLLKCTGYYTVHVTSDSEPQTELLVQMALVPGTFARFALQTLNASTQSALTESVPRQ